MRTRNVSISILKLMHQYYKDKGDYARQKETIIKLFSCADGGDLYKLYQNCKEELTGLILQKRRKNFWR